MTTYILICVTLFLIGMLFNEVIHNFQKAYGTLRIDKSNPEKDIYRLELDKLDDLSKRKFVILKVDNDADLSQK